jgi:hypothetical protein
MQLGPNKPGVSLTAAFLVICARFASYYTSPLNQLNILHKEGDFSACRTKFNDFQRIKIEIYDEGTFVR